MKKSLLALIFSTTIVLSACIETDAPTQVEQTVGAEVDAPRVTLIEAGNNPRVWEYNDIGNTSNNAQKLNLDIAEGLNQETRQSDSADSTPTPAEVYTLSVPIEAKTIESDSGTRSVTLSLGEAEYDDPRFANDIATITGFHFGWFADHSGKISSVNLAAPTNASDYGRSLSEQFLTKLIPAQVVFPTEAVGLGGSWTVAARVAGDSTLLQNTTYTITAIDGDQVSLDVDIAQRPALGALTAEDGTTLKVLNAQTTSNSSLVVDINQPLPVSGMLNYTTRVIYGDEASNIRVLQDTTTRISY
ncbi:hypothetical protein ACFLIN_02065 [Corynebacterium kutscheri]|uniref:Secreted protein n=1 Tax=Corynebacterium kutscheri TaxID=35755 RepID=A0A0F6TDS9_9CORY|nr:hypothetical protein [Corynebacterium kutscheri]AKE41546.1 hypothetical protein UL82_06905 [Corynebacterium kutscheri]VEH09870.1 putative secreted protein [Corynebacterium kutscheri]